jgi:hypothetical protein
VVSGWPGQGTSILRPVVQDFPAPYRPFVQDLDPSLKRLHRARFWLSKAAFRLPQILPGLDVRHDAFIQRAPFHRAFLARLLLRMVYKLCRAVCIYKLLGAGNKRIRRAWRG